MTKTKPKYNEDGILMINYKEFPNIVECFHQLGVNLKDHEEVKAFFTHTHIKIEVDRVSKITRTFLDRDIADTIGFYIYNAPDDGVILDNES